MKADVLICENDRGILWHNPDGTYTLVYTTPPTWEITKVDNLKREDLKNQPHVTQAMIDCIK